MDAHRSSYYYNTGTSKKHYIEMSMVSIIHLDAWLQGICIMILDQNLYRHSEIPFYKLPRQF